DDESLLQWPSSLDIDSVDTNRNRQFEEASLGGEATLIEHSHWPKTLSPHSRTGLNTAVSWLPFRAVHLQSGLLHRPTVLAPAISQPPTQCPRSSISTFG